jgi:hypothetical protein
MRFAISVLAALVTVAHLDATDHRRSYAPYARIRPMQDVGARLLADGMAHSPTFRWLVDRLDRSNVIVYIDVRPDMPAHLGGSLRFLARSATDHFVKIQLNRVFHRKTLVALLAHELQHAVEVAESGQVNSADDLRQLYRRVGVLTGTDQYDTVAAQRAGYVVRDELNQTHQADFRLARSADLDPLPDTDDRSTEPAADPPASDAAPANRGMDLTRQED